MIELRNITKTYRKGKEKLLVLDNFSMTLHRGETIAVMGKSGSGKSTLARILLLLEKADSGEIVFDGHAAVGSKSFLLPYRRKVQYVSQRPESFFDPTRTLRTSVLAPAKIHHLEMPVAERRLGTLLDQVRINYSVLNRYPYQVSGGEIQRIAICRALLTEPAFLVLDEATSMLDVSVQAQILNILKELQREKNLGFLFISHDMAVVDWFTKDVPGKRIDLQR